MWSASDPDGPVVINVNNPAAYSSWWDRNLVFSTSHSVARAEL